MSKAYLGSLTSAGGARSNDLIYGEKGSTNFSQPLSHLDWNSRWLGAGDFTPDLFTGLEEVSNAVSRISSTVKVFSATGMLDIGGWGIGSVTAELYWSGSVASTITQVAWRLRLNALSSLSLGSALTANSTEATLGASITTVNGPASVEALLNTTSLGSLTLTTTEPEILGVHIIREGGTSDTYTGESYFYGIKFSFISS
jgi:hypothetical protein